MIIIGATNFLHSIDDAILRPGRFDRKIFVGPPDAEARAEGFKMYLQSFPQDKLRFDYIADMAEFFTYADISSICESIKRYAIRSKIKINTDLVGKFVSKFRPDLDSSKIQEYF